MADKQYTDMDELAVKYIAGEADAAGRLQVEQWLEESEENRTHFNHFKLLWDKTNELNARSTIDEDAAWDRFRARIQKNYADPAQPKRNLLWLKMAAILLMVLGVTLLARYFTGSNSGARTVFTGAGASGSRLMQLVSGAETKTDTLADGSVVKLAPHSDLEYPQTFSGNKRYVELQGEAFFNVVHENSCPFVIKTNNLLVTVLGTSFNIKTAGSSTEVTVTSGVVSVEKGKHIMRLNAGERLRYLAGDSAWVKSIIFTNTLFNGKAAAYAVKSATPGTDSVLDFKKHPDLLQNLLKNPAKWSSILKSYRAQNNDIRVRRAVVRDVIAEIKKEKLAGQAPVRSFRLNENEFFINEERQPDAVQKRFKNIFLKEPGYRVYFSDIPKTGRGIFLSPDSL